MGMKNGSISALRQIHLFSSITEEELECIASKLSLKSFKRGQVVFHEDDTNRYMYAVLSGKVKVYKTTVDGKETTLATHGQGDSFGELSLLDGKTEPATVASIENCTLAIISKSSFHELLASNARLSSALLRIFCARLRESWRIIEMLNMKNAAQRVRLMLLILAEKEGERLDDGILIRQRLTHQGIAEMTGLTRESVTRVLDSWINDGSISIDSKKIVVLKKSFFTEDFPDVI